MIDAAVIETEYLCSIGHDKTACEEEFLVKLERRRMSTCFDEIFKNHFIERMGDLNERF